MTAPLCFLDTETDGVHYGRRPWEVAMIRREPDGTETTFHAFLEIDLESADPAGLRIGGFYDRHPLGRYLSGLTDRTPIDRPRPAIPGAAVARPLRAVAPHIARMTHGAHIVGAVPNFDTELLARILHRAGFAPAWHYHLIDVENLAVGYLAADGQGTPPPWSSDTITAALGIPPVPEEDRHTAMGDVRWAMAIYDRVMQPQQQLQVPA